MSTSINRQTPVAAQAINERLIALFVTCLSLALVALTFTSAVAQASQARRHCVAPSVRGKTLTRAETMIRRAHCRLGRISRQDSTTVEAGRVISQSPRAGRKLAVNVRLNLVESLGSRSHRCRTSCPPRTGSFSAQQVSQTASLGLRGPLSALIARAVAKLSEAERQRLEEGLKRVSSAQQQAGAAMLERTLTGLGPAEQQAVVDELLHVASPAEQATVAAIASADEQALDAAIAQAATTGLDDAPGDFAPEFSPWCLRAACQSGLTADNAQLLGPVLAAGIAGTQGLVGEALERAPAPMRAELAVADTGNVQADPPGKFLELMKFLRTDPPAIPRVTQAIEEAYTRCTVSGFGVGPCTEDDAQLTLIVMFPGTEPLPGSLRDAFTDCIFGACSPAEQDAIKQYLQELIVHNAVDQRLSERMQETKEEVGFEWWLTLGGGYCTEIPHTGSCLMRW